MLCKTCDKRDACGKLCEDAKSYVNQDYVPITKQTPNIGDSIYDFNDEESAWDYSKDKYTSSELIDIIIKLHQNGLTPSEILYHLPCNKTYVYRIIQEFSTKL